MNYNPKCKRRDNSGTEDCDNFKPIVNRRNIMEQVLQRKQNTCNNNCNS